jgi:catechol 2,3-dioxygenase-like lactoylglutathione lyase family enzyme
MAAQFGFDHIHLRARDPEATAAWFERSLGAEVIRTMPGGKPRFDLKLGGQDIFIAQSDASVAAPPASPYHGLDHFGLTVPWGAMDGAVAALKEKGVAFTMEPKEIRPGVRICFIQGPENISIEILERK